MASLGHVAVGMAAARLGAVPRDKKGALALSMLLWSALSMLPDADVIGLSFGVRYGAPWGHRGATHSFAFSLALGIGIGAVAALRRRSGLRTAVLASLVLVSHALLDTLTDGGRGCALFWPLSDARHFAPYRPIPVAPIGFGFLSTRGLRVALVELVLFAPCFAYALWPRRRERSEVGVTPSNAG
jgi:inner membrane protein